MNRRLVLKSGLTVLLAGCTTPQPDQPPITIPELTVENLEYDLTFVVNSLVDGYWFLLPDTPDHHEPAQTDLLTGYKQVGSPRVIEQFHANRGCYNLLADLHLTLNFDGWFDLIDIEDEQRDYAAERLRIRLRRHT